MERTAEYVKAQYDKAWKGVFPLIIRCIHNKASLLDFYIQITNGPQVKAQAENALTSDLIPKTTEGVPLQNIIVFMNRVIFGPQFQTGSNMLFHSIQNLCDQHTDIVLELGSGTGKNLAFAYSGLKQRFPSIRYIAAEWSNAGRECSNLLKKLDPSFPLDVHEYNYHEPDYSFIPKDSNVVLFTSHSIEQIPEIKPAVFEGLFERTKNVKFVLFEPVGWQWNNEACEFYEKLQEKTEIPLDPKNFLDSVGQEYDPRWAASYSFNTDYNKNLKRIIEDLVAKKILACDAIILNEYGFNPCNPSTRIVGRFNNE